MTYTDVAKSIPGLKHYYPLTSDAQDVISTQHGAASGVTFSGGKAVFNGSAKVDLGDHNDFSVATNRGLTIACFLTIDDWHGKGATEYVHWAGKGSAGSHEWTFRHYVTGGTGEASTREGRLSFYHFNPAGGLGAGSYFQDSTHPTTERFIVATCDMSTISLYVNGAQKDSDPLSGYSIVPQNTSSHAILGTRGDGTGFLVGKLRRVGFWNRVLTPAEISTLYAARDQTDSAPDPAQPDPLLALGIDQTSKVHNALVAALRQKGVI
jgi:hypothetical protein